VTARKRGVTVAQLRKLALSFPGTEEGTSYGTLAFRVRKKLWLRLQENDVTLVVKSTWEERDTLMESDPKTFFITDHYENYEWVLVDLKRISRDALEDVLEGSWRRLASKKMTAEFESR
jgi:hypothetical protein